MEAKKLFAAPINEAMNGWRIVTGNSAISDLDEYNKVAEKLRLTFPGMPDVVKTACIKDGSGMLILVSDYVKNIFPAGHEHHDWAWEVNKAGGRGRQMEYIMGYRFNEGESVIPHISVIKEQAAVDAAELLKKTYKAVDETGKGYLPDQPPAVFSHAGKEHEGIWKETIDRWLKGEEITSFINAGDEYVLCPAELKKNSETIQASRPKDIPTQTTVLEAAAKSQRSEQSFRKTTILNRFLTTKGLAVALGATVVIGSMAYLYQMHLKKEKDQLHQAKS